MQDSVKVYDLLISCPSDVTQFVDSVEDAVEKFNNFFGRENNIILRIISWKNNSFPQLGSHPQKILNSQIVKSSDMCVAIFWTRFGTETEDYGSGTEEEIENMLKDGKQVFLYFLDKPVKPSDINQEQYSKILAFKEKNKNKGLFFNIPDEQKLVVQFKEHLELYMGSLIHGEEISKNQGDKLILWVDDCPENNVYIRNIFQNYGIKIDLSLSTESALRLLSNNNYSLIISDMGRKEGSREGYVLLKKIRDNGNGIPFIIFASGGSLPQNKEKAREKGAQFSTNYNAELVDKVLKLLINS